MRSVLPERRHVNGHALLEGAMESAYDHLMTRIGQELASRLARGTKYVLGRAPYVRRATSLLLAPSDAVARTGRGEQNSQRAAPHVMGG
jgi:hypothetical protein